MRRIAFTCLLMATTAVVGAACTDDETPFNEIDRLRVLGISASSPWLLEGETTTLEALVVNNDPALQDEELRYRWYFCPIQADSTVGFECVVQSAEDLETFTGTDSLTGLEDAEFSEFGVLISTSSVSVVLPFALPASTIADFCLALDDIDLPLFVTRPECNGRFPVTVYLEVGAAATGGVDPTEVDPDRRVVAFRDVDLVYDQTLEINPPHENPEIASLALRPRGADDFQELPASSVTTLRFDRTYDLLIDVELEQSEMFVPDDDDEADRESLTVTWFVEGGETDSVRTGYLPLDDGESFEDLVGNDWTTPRQIDFGDRRDARLFLVIRDNRGGLSWLIRDIQFDDATGL